MAVGIVVVSHSFALAEAAKDLAMQMVATSAPSLALAAGTPDGGFGTDAVAVADAIAAVDQGEGVLVLVDLGSAVLSAEMALEFLPDPDADVRVVAAPFVEGLLAATVRAATGGTIDEVAAEARAALAPKQEQLGDLDNQPTAAALSDASAAAPDGASAATAAAGEAAAAASYDASASVTLINPMGLHARPAAAIAGLVAGFSASVEITSPGGKSVAAISPLAVAGLGTKGGDTVTVQATGDDAQAAVAALQELIASGFGEVEVPATADTQAEPQTAGAQAKQQANPITASAADSDAAAVTAGSQTAVSTIAAQRPLGVSSGRVVGTVLRMPEPIAEPAFAAPLAATEREAAVAKLTVAAERVVAQLQQQAKEATGHTADILTATAGLAADPHIVEAATEQILEQGTAPERAVWAVLHDVAQQFTAAGGALAERASDVRSVRAQLVAELTGQSLPEVPQSDEPFILVARDLAPADTAKLDPHTCIGIVLGEGGPTSHTAILARSYGIAAVIAQAAYATLQDGDTVLIDGDSGEVVIAPSAAEVATARTKPQLLTALAPLQNPGALKSGEPISLLANVGGAKDVPLAVERGAEGVGLFRTEFCFLGRQAAPSFAEQKSAYAEVFAGFSGKKVVVRTLDAGSDKPLPFVTNAVEENPALGVRGLRTSWFHPEVLTTQLAAIAAAAAETGAEPWVMAPMVATVSEAAEFAQLAKEQGLTPESGAKLGVMIETPAAALLTGELFAVVDFVSLGTNDLTQYTMAADRMATELAHLNSPWQPAVLRLIATVGSEAAGGAVGVCGEAASDPLLAAVLVGLGVTSLSMTATALPLVGEKLAQLDLESCKQAAAAACAAGDAAAARQAAAQVIGG